MDGKINSNHVIGAPAGEAILKKPKFLFSHIGLPASFLAAFGRCGVAAGAREYGTETRIGRISGYETATRIGRIRGYETATRISGYKNHDFLTRRNDIFRL